MLATAPVMYRTRLGVCLHNSTLRLLRCQGCEQCRAMQAANMWATIASNAAITRCPHQPATRLNQSLENLKHRQDCFAAGANP